MVGRQSTLLRSCSGDCNLRRRRVRPIHPLSMTGVAWTIRGHRALVAYFSIIVDKHQPDRCGVTQTRLRPKFLVSRQHSAFPTHPINAEAEIRSSLLMFRRPIVAVVYSLLSPSQQCERIADSFAKDGNVHLRV